MTHVTKTEGTAVTVIVGTALAFALQLADARRTSMFARASLISGWFRSLPTDRRILF